MDNLCHTLAGAALGEAGLKGRTRFAQATLMIAANLPDIDVFVFATDGSSLAFRRGWTHGPLAQALLPLVLTGVVVGFGKLFPARSSKTPVHAGWLLILAYLGVWSHVALDLLNPYGLRILAPFDWRWFYGDTLFIIDPWIWLALGAGVWLSRRGRTMRHARRGLWVSVAYIVVMIAAARSARHIVIDAWTAQHGRAPQAVMVGPVAITPLRRQVVIDAGDHYEAGTFQWLPRRTELDASVPKNEADWRVTAARSAPEIASFLVWSRFPFWTFEPATDGTRVRVSDMRFTAQSPVRFSASTIVTDPAAAPSARP